MTSGRNSRLNRGAAALVIVATSAWFFGRALFTDVFFAVRDAVHFYYPLFSWTTKERWAGRLPLWCPFEGLGTPLLADATAGLFYPGQLLLFLPFGFDFNFKLYIVAHYFVAAIGVYRLSRTWRASPPAATIAAISYAFGGSVLFQYCNPVFLVGAAWLPFAVREVWGLLAKSDSLARQRVLTLAFFLALMVLGGDPQTAYHVGIIAAFGWIYTSRRRVPAFSLAAAAVVAIGLSAVQVFPSVSRSGETTRAISDVPRSIYEAPRFAAADVSRGLLGVPLPETHHANLYDFSLGPWRWLELIWPNVGGQALPTHRRWMAAIPAEGRLWTPSLYMGLLPALVGLLELFRRGNARARWLRATLLLFAAGSLGWYGLGWLCRELGAACGADTPTWFVGQPVGGVYWFFVTFLPGYVQFRYPAKLWTVVALCVACFAARGVDRLLRGNRARLMYVLQGMIGASLVLVSMLAIGASRLMAIPVAADDSLGPFDAIGSIRDVFAALGSTVLLAALLLILARLPRRAPQLGWILAIVTAVDLALANGGQVLVAPAAILREYSQVSQRVPIPRFYRAPWADWSPRSWAERGDPNRLTQIAAWGRATGFGRLPLLDDYGSLRGYSTLRSADYECLLELVETHRELIPFLGGDKACVPDNAEDSQLLSFRTAYPRAWFAAEIVRQLPLPSNASLTKRAACLREIYFPGEQPRDLRRTAVVETDTRLSPGDPSLALTVVREEGGELTLDVPAESRGGFLVINVMFDPGWQATDGAGRPLQLIRANRVLLGCDVPAETRRIELRYRPRSFTLGACISGLTLAAIVIVYLRTKR